MACTPFRTSDWFAPNQNQSSNWKPVTSHHSISRIHLRGSVPRLLHSSLLHPSYLNEETSTGNVLIYSKPQKADHYKVYESSCVLLPTPYFHYWYKLITRLKIGSRFHCDRQEPLSASSSLAVTARTLFKDIMNRLR